MGIKSYMQCIRARKKRAMGTQKRGDGTKFREDFFITGNN